MRLRTSVEELGSDSLGRFWEEQASTGMILGAKGNLAIRHKNCMNVSLEEQLCWTGVRGVRRWPGRSWRTAADYTPTTHIPTHRYSTLTKPEWNLKFLKSEPENSSLEFWSKFSWKRFVFGFSYWISVVEPWINVDKIVKKRMQWREVKCVLSIKESYSMGFKS